MFSRRPVSNLTDGPDSKNVATFPDAQLVRLIVNGVRPAVPPLLRSRALRETVGRVTVKSRPPGVEIVQVLSVTLPLNVTVPSAALADSGASRTTKGTKHVILFNS